MSAPKKFLLDARYGHELLEVDFRGGDVHIALMQGAIRKNLAIDGGLFAEIIRYTAGRRDRLRRDADRLDKILKGEKP